MKIGQNIETHGHLYIEDTHTMIIGSVGSGKTTICNKLYNYYRSMGNPVYYITKQPQDNNDDINNVISTTSLKELIKILNKIQNKIHKTIKKLEKAQVDNYIYLPKVTRKILIIDGLDEYINLDNTEKVNKLIEIIKSIYQLGIFTGITVIISLQSTECIPKEWWPNYAVNNLIYLGNNNTFSIENTPISNFEKTTFTLNLGEGLYVNKDKLAKFMF